VFGDLIVVILMVVMMMVMTITRKTTKNKKKKKRLLIMDIMLKINVRRAPKQQIILNNFLRSFDGYSGDQKILGFYEDVESLPCLLESNTDPCDEELNSSLGTGIIFRAHFNLNLHLFSCLERSLLLSNYPAFIIY
jgi:hypothetical protein